MKRIVFRSSKSRDIFFGEVFKSFSFKTWKEFYLFFKIPKSVFEKYKSGYLTLPEFLFIQISRNLKADRIAHFSSCITHLNNNWGRIKGGKTTYYRHVEIFDRGRILGLKNMSRKGSSKYKIDRDIRLNKDLSYFIGLFIGDGFTNVYDRHYVVQFTGHWYHEYKFYNESVRNVVKNLFSINPYIRHDYLSNAIRFNLFSKDLYILLTQRFKIKPGKKSYDILIPEEILGSASQLLMACIGGIYDAEACVFFDKRKKYTKPYPRIDLHMVNPPLIKQISEILNQEGIQHGINGDYERILIYGEKNIIDFLKKIPLINPKHTDKLSSILPKGVIVQNLI